MNQPSGLTAASNTARYSSSCTHALPVMRTTPVSTERPSNRPTIQRRAPARRVPFHSSPASQEPIAQGQQSPGKDGKTDKHDGEVKIFHDGVLLSVTLMHIVTAA